MWEVDGDEEDDPQAEGNKADDEDDYEPDDGPAPSTVATEAQEAQPEERLKGDLDQKV